MPTTCARNSAKVASSATFYQLNNGLKLIHQEIPTAATVTVDVWIEAGAIAEPDDLPGLAHFLEHMIFKGTDQIAPGEFDVVIESQGGVANAATSHDYVHFMFTSAVNNFRKTIAYLADMLLHASIPDNEFDQERLVVIEEIHQALDDPDWLAYQNLLNIAYPQHPYSRSILGTPDILENLTAEQMRQYHRSHYRPEKMTVVVVGAISLQEALDVVGRSFTLNSDRHAQAWESSNLINASHKSINSNSTNLTLNSPSTLEIKEICRQIEYLPRLQHSRLTMAWLGPSVNNWEEALKFELLTVILAAGRTSRLVRELREDLAWVHDIGASFSMQKEPGLFTICAYLDACYLEHVEHKIQQHIVTLRTDLISSAELERAKRNLRNNFAFAVESPHQLASFLGYHGMLGCEELCANWSTAYSELISSVEPADILKLAQTYLSPEQYILTGLVPEIC